MDQRACRKRTKRSGAPLPAARPLNCPLDPHHCSMMMAVWEALAGRSSEKATPPAPSHGREAHRGAGCYHTGTFRANGRLSQEYVGTSMMAKLAAREGR